MGPHLDRVSKELEVKVEENFDLNLEDKLKLNIKEINN